MLEIPSNSIWNEYRARVLASLTKPVAFPAVTEMFDRRLFLDWSTTDEAKFPNPIKWRSSSISTFSRTRGSGTYRPGAIHLLPSYNVIDYIKKEMLCIPNDQVSFNIVHHDNGFSLVTAQHSTVSGGRWLAYVATMSMPDLIRKPMES